MQSAGFASVDITPRVGMCVPGGFAPRASTGVLDALGAHACVLEAEETVALVGVDAVSLTFPTVEAVRARVNAACGIPARNILIAASHTHCGGPSNSVLGSDADTAYLEQLEAGISDAVTQAWRSREPATLAAAVGNCEGWAFNRRFRMRGGSERTNPGKGNPDMLEPAGPVDSEVSVVGVRAASGAWLGCIANYACHSTVVSGTQFSADYSARWRWSLRERLGDACEMVFLNGACGDINQLDFTNVAVRESGTDWAERMGAALAEATAAALRGAEFAADADIASAHGDVFLHYRHPSREQLADARAVLESESDWTSKKWQARDLLLLADEIAGRDGMTCPVDVYRVGAALIAAAPWQPFCEYGLSIKRDAGERPVLVACFANGMVGYVPTPQGFEGGGYEPTLCRGSKLTPDAGDLIVAETQRLMGRSQ